MKVWLVSPSAAAVNGDVIDERPFGVPDTHLISPGRRPARPRRQGVRPHTRRDQQPPAPPLRTAVWDADDVRDDVRSWLVEQLGHPDAVLSPSGRNHFGRAEVRVRHISDRWGL
ncbi:hypothetical protein [Micromonospora sp. NPDC051141]|uniref:hypothetical protein n=1 Tax=Micromonospora sp. NPDC051141 TaxID=3364284 RepID=UPI0037AAF041